MPLFSVLDLSPVPDGSTVHDALRNSAALARHAETLGYTRFWMAEHHNMPGIASAATAVALTYIAGQTETIRVGAGGVMLPNHAPLVIAEQFGTLATLYPGRVDLGLGRAPGTDMGTARALRRNLAGADSFPQDVVELMDYFADAPAARGPHAIPGVGTQVPVFILGSSLYGAQLAAHLGLPYAFASHFAPAALDQALAVYRETYRPSERHPRPYFILAANVFAAETDDEGALLKSSMEQAFVNLRTGNPGKLPRPQDGYRNGLDGAAQAMLDQALAVSAVGSLATVHGQLAAFVERWRPDEVILTGQIHNHAARLRSFTIAAEAMRRINAARQAA
ncbi:LLM class flavin-dependent oxidoreductase [Jiella sp. MQZ9-1]|uniref:Luciferase-like monooxygenase n=1 Tax=Jiella flava TaxID=2816857 RepID=A0A939JWU5_9HYPH|nr:LLM class flavin-dependent oxidoreductase [Jiella flava]MBO0663889.1 LLM class flavin-dependent oxidoreductase [Jiella flava]MCD2472461.1 LLM class flavin-dependent oxidoreductase [Jiella flava]